MKRVLIITYYWPPSGGAGVQRWLKFSKYLPENGWQPVVFTPENPEIPVVDESLKKDIPEQVEVVKIPIWEPYQLYKRFAGIKKEDKIQPGFATDRKKSALVEYVSLWTRGNLFIPDARKFWIGPSVKYLKQYLKDHPVDAIVSTGPPHSMHLIALKLKKHFDIKWIADFRDPWSTMDYLDKMHLSSLAWKRHRQLEQKVFDKADHVLSVSNTWASEMNIKDRSKVSVITNGFDGKDFENDTDVAEDDSFNIVYAGILSEYRIPHGLFEALNALMEGNDEFYEKTKIIIYGSIDQEVYRVLENYPKVKERFIFKGYVAHDEVIEKYKKASLLLLILNNSHIVKGNIPGKFFEYLGSGKPILAIGSEEGDVAEILHSGNHGAFVTGNDVSRFKERLLAFFKGDSTSADISKGDVSKFDRKNLTKALVEILNGPMKND
ncbi:glycosyltransferase [Puteibacter caeruleilacunae]|nr:glycosyltransferase [Puteibacter caeruleilacunae]